MSDHPENLIAASEVGLAFERAEPILHDISFGIQAGEFVTLLGPSGCGKSTLLRLIAGLLEPTSGNITLAGQRPVHARRDGQRIGIVFQDPVLLPWRSVSRNIRLPAELASDAVEQAGIDELLDLVGLDRSDAGKRPSQLSGGMRMRVSLARALVNRPELFLLDEPFAALDDVLRQQLNEELLRIRERQGCTTVFVTHNVAEAVFLSQRILVLTSGPAEVASEVIVPFEYPRRSELKATPEFGRFVSEVSEQLRGAASCVS